MSLALVAEQLAKQETISYRESGLTKGVNKESVNVNFDNLLLVQFDLKVVWVLCPNS